MLAFRTWSCMPGRLVVLEALLRSGPIASGDDVCKAVGHMLLPSNNAAPGSLSVCISLAATVHKLVNQHLSCAPQDLEMSQHSGLSPVASSHEIRRDSMAMFETCCEYVIQFLHTPVHTNASSSHTSRTGDSTTDSGSSGSIGGSSIQDGSEACAGCRVPPQGTFQLQLHSVLLMSVVQYCYWQDGETGRLSVNPKYDGSGWWEKVRDRQPNLLLELTELVAGVLTADVMHSPKAHAIAGEMWGQFALRFFHGRLLPGCGHLGCTNLAGVSEAALPTLLCSGCRRVRYCSAQCQREAWVDGGHSSVCGR